jgi:hypothetical protein
MATLIAQRIASLAMKKKMTSRTTPAITNMVVKLMINQSPVASRQSPVTMVAHIANSFSGPLPTALFVLLSAYCLLPTAFGFL